MPFQISWGMRGSSAKAVRTGRLGTVYIAGWCLSVSCVCVCVGGGI